MGDGTQDGLYEIEGAKLFRLLPCRLFALFYGATSKVFGLIRLPPLHTSARVAIALCASRVVDALLQAPVVLVVGWCMRQPLAVSAMRVRR